ncbi:hypothetical protein DR64_1322 [Paraburkholderia xenovorans LB400]|uniref:Uncharacterized protein n=1 Tax=Paraburkholderia xenovorans (strain LB400) TaxID=266265 RepID=Q143Y0_PARXL|nr:hypothetical protein Bxe_A4508 [Paraburkholderia xenovorans LB400]AIP29535.1 hypothetical protein DR64_1322 [Paraburkholderia xenovorans LB400]
MLSKVWKLATVWFGFFALFHNAKYRRVVLQWLHYAFIACWNQSNSQVFVLKRVVSPNYLRCSPMGMNQSIVHYWHQSNEKMV